MGSKTYRKYECDNCKQTSDPVSLMSAHDEEKLPPGWLSISGRVADFNNITTKFFLNYRRVFCSLSCLQAYIYADLEATIKAMQSKERKQSGV